MIVLLDASIFQELGSTSSRYYLNILNILYNKELKIVLNKQLQDYYSTYFSEKSLYQPFITEIIDTQRFHSADAKNCPDEDLFLKLYDIIRTPLLIPICIDKNIPQIKNLVDLKKAKKNNKDWTAHELLTKNFCNLSFSDFKSDKEILEFVESLFEIPKYIADVNIFCREVSSKFLGILKGKNVNFYTLGNRSINDLKDDLHFLKQNVSRRTKLFSTKNPRIIHERKIIFESIIITFDNSFENTTKSEPTWEIFVSIDRSKADYWLNKIDKFNEIYIR